ncbi:fibronectin type III domain-containing protein 8 [Hemicordylus capensis]|uniref:fibronectin type III domain-containing protein 8 n=1 Tax=Hemicordylus capensis TaxID=884348 RepID=UPI0023046831|nr:fibronectin type III domain-containing protein 8 [Hemicordylus capensis]XP_053124787.1 fibronectin type III domain-containing protein 8 [Hemicordylus capensis]
MFQLYRNLEASESETTSPCQNSSGEVSKQVLSSANSLPQTLDDLLAGLFIDIRPEKDDRKHQLNRPRLSGIPAVPVDLDMSDGETSVSDSGSESPVCVELPPQPFIYQHSASHLSAELSWTGPRSGELVSFYELQLEEARLVGQGKNIQWFCSDTEEHLANLNPDTEYVIYVRALNVAGAGMWSEPYKFATLPPVPGIPLDPPPVIIIVKRHRKPQKKTVFLPAA